MKTNLISFFQKNKIDIKSFIIIIIFFSSCKVTYFPTLPAVPNQGSKERNTRFNVCNTNIQMSNWYNIDSNYYITNSIMAGFAISDVMFYDMITSQSEKQVTPSYFTYLFGIGYQTNFKNIINYQIETGYGKSNGSFNSNFFTVNKNFADLYYKSNRLYLQPSLSLISRGSAKLFIIYRFVFENYYDLKEIPLYLRGYELKTANFHYNDIYFLIRTCRRDVYFEQFIGTSLPPYKSSNINYFNCKLLSLGFSLIF